MTNELSVEKAIDVLYTIRAYYASLTAGYPKGKDCRGIGDVMCSEIANSCLMAIKALEQTRWIPVSERLPKDHEKVLIYLSSNRITIGLYRSHRLPFMDKPIGWGTDAPHDWSSDEVISWMPLPQPYKAASEGK